VGISFLLSDASNDGIKLRPEAADGRGAGTEPLRPGARGDVVTFRIDGSQHFQQMRS
jgi:hypothetical protein